MTVIPSARQSEPQARREPGASEESLRSEQSASPVTSTALVLRDAQTRLAASNVEDAALEAELLFAYALRITRAQLYARMADPLTDDLRKAFEGLVERRVQREPLAYITGHREFYGIDLLCTPAALIPRQETELLVELALKHLERLVAANFRSPHPVVVDVGTGSGAVAIAIAKHAPVARVIATDTSSEALGLAQQNARRCGVSERIEFVRGSLLGSIQHADVIIANLPYISDGVYASLSPELYHEPEDALRAGPRGTELIELLLTQARDVLALGGLLIAEHAWDQGDHLRRAAQAFFPNAQIETKRDLAGLERALVMRLATDRG